MTTSFLTGVELDIARYVAASPTPDLVASTLETLREYQSLAFKACATDGELVPLLDFSPDASRPDYLSRECKAHRAAAARERRNRGAA